MAAYTYTVDAVGNRTQVIEGALITTTTPVTTSHNSIASGALATNGSRGSVTSFTGGSAILAFTRIRQTTATTLSVATINYIYDPLYRLTAANYSTGQVYTYTYDAVGNRLSDGATAGVNVYTHDDANRINTINGVDGSFTYTWDNNGNMLADNNLNYSYDAANRLAEVHVLRGPGSTTYDYTYTGLGNLERSLVTVCIGTWCSYTPITTTLDLAGGPTQVLADGTNTYLYGDGHIAQYAGASAQYFLDDALGSMRQLADASGAVNLARSYQPYGSVLTSAGAGTTSYGFTGEWTSSQTGLIDLRARQYSPTVGRFIQKDSWAGSYIKLAEPGVSYDGSGTGQVSTGDWSTDYSSPQSLNRWAYADDDPINRVDPTGHLANHFQVILRYALRYGFTPEYVIPSTIPAGPPLWPGQRRGKGIDLVDWKKLSIYEVEPYNPSGVYPAGHGPSQVQNYLDLLNYANGGSGTAFVNKWTPGGPVDDIVFPTYDGLGEVRAFWDQPGLIVFEEHLNIKRMRELVTDFCEAAFLAWLAKQAIDRVGGTTPAPQPGYASMVDQLRLYLDSLSHPAPWIMPVLTPGLQ